MLKNLKIEWLKVRSYRTFWVLLALFIICTVGVNYIVYQSKSDVKMQPVSMLIGNPFSFPDVWHTVGYISSFLLFLPGLIVLILVTNEYNYKTHRQNIIDGISRFDFVVTKIFLAIEFALLATLLSFIIAMVIGLCSGSTSFSLNNLNYIFYFFLQALTYTFSGVLFGFLFKRSGLAIALYFIYLIFIKNILSFLANHFLSGMGDYFPIKSADNLIPLPFFRNITQNVFMEPNETLLIIFTIGYLAAFCFIVIKKFTTEDL